MFRLDSKLVGYSLFSNLTGFLASPNYWISSLYMPKSEGHWAGELFTDWLNHHGGRGGKTPNVPIAVWLGAYNRLSFDWLTASRPIGSTPYGIGESAVESWFIDPVCITARQQWRQANHCLDSSIASILRLVTPYMRSAVLQGIDPCFHRYQIPWTSKIRNSELTSNMTVMTVGYEMDFHDESMKLRKSDSNLAPFQPRRGFVLAKAVEGKKTEPWRVSYLNFQQHDNDAVKTINNEFTDMCRQDLPTEAIRSRTNRPPTCEPYFDYRELQLYFAISLLSVTVDSLLSGYLNCLRVRNLSDILHDSDLNMEYQQFSYHFT
ncbi:unnamed protein product [Protopolystoma xenopodis]|uniref:Uncharacterized protein n=1 Tax=Protopolystoma xenopodis TaxID=117903 RepID=A0A3S5CES5_9PLAT|nr:unnamed protein product [Protopolystoma xenopodis]